MTQLHHPDRGASSRRRSGRSLARLWTCWWDFSLMVLSFPFVRLGCAAWESYFGPGLIVELVRLALVMCIPWVTFALAWRHETLGGLAEVFKSNVWTLTYRELRALEGLEPEPGELPEPDTADVE